MSKQPSLKQENSQQSIEELQKRYETLNTRKIQAEANRDNAKKRLEELQQQARERYGTCDVDELKEKLATMRQENEKQRNDYQRTLEKIEGDLEAVEEKFAQTEEAAAVSETT